MVQIVVVTKPSSTPLVLPKSHPSISGGGYWPTTMVNGQSSIVAKVDIVGFFFYSAAEYMTRWERMESTSGQ